MRIRQAHLRDAKQLANLHFICSSVQPGSFMHHLGRRFFVEYYKIILRDGTSVVLCADAGRNGTVGFVSATLDSKKHLEAVRKGRVKLLLSAVPALFRKPNIIRALYIRNKSWSANLLGEGFIVTSGTRIDYWGWLPSYPSNGKSTLLLKEMMAFMEKQGVSKLQLEVDRVNRKVEVMHRLLGAKVVKGFTTRDGRERIMMEYELNPVGSQLHFVWTNGDPL